jgi:hypothetical protein
MKKSPQLNSFGFSAAAGSDVLNGLSLGGNLGGNLGGIPSSGGLSAGMNNDSLLGFGKTSGVYDPSMEDTDDISNLLNLKDITADPADPNSATVSSMLSGIVDDDVPR